MYNFVPGQNEFSEENTLSMFTMCIRLTYLKRKNMVIETIRKAKIVGKIIYSKMHGASKTLNFCLTKVTYINQIPWETEKIFDYKIY
jgi:hypothetical protein